MKSKTANPGFMSVLQELTRTYQAFEQYSNQHIRQLGLTPPQFDVVTTLGDGQGMNCKELSDRTMITKGTLTGVIDRLESKGLVTRTPLQHDRRSVFVALTQNGQILYRQAFPRHVDHMQHAFKSLGEKDLSTIRQELGRLRSTFHQASGAPEEELG